MSGYKVGNQTSSQDPQAVRARVFVGNLNTFRVNKSDVEKCFQRYGRIVGISMHKGYAFVQFATPFDARSACLGEDGRNIAGQTIDVNMVSEPKPHQQKTRKPSNTNSNVSPTVNNNNINNMENNDMKGTQGLEEPEAILNTAGTEDEPMTADEYLNQLKHYDASDILICGNCRSLFTRISDLVAHKRHYCKLRFMCSCRDEELEAEANRLASAPELQCGQCDAIFDEALELLTHFEQFHQIRLVDNQLECNNANEMFVSTP